MTLSSKVRRRDLLPPYLQQDIWVELADAIDTLWGNTVENQIDALGKLRELWIANKAVEADVEKRILVDPSKYSSFDPTTEMLRMNLLGVALTAPNFISLEDSVRINRNVASFWYSKGLGDFIDFIGYCLNVKAEMINLWTEDYIVFVPEGQHGTPLWEGGTWYPTTHVQVKFDPGKYMGFPVVSFIQLFYDIANYDLVIEKLISEAWIDINCWVALGVVTSVYHVFPQALSLTPDMYATPGKIEKIEHWIHSE